MVYLSYIKRSSLFQSQLDLKTADNLLKVSTECLNYGDVDEVCYRLYCPNQVGRSLFIIQKDNYSLVSNWLRKGSEKTRTLVLQFEAIKVEMDGIINSALKLRNFPSFSQLESFSRDLSHTFLSLCQYSLL